MLFKASAPAAPAGEMVIARLNVRAQPLDRGEVFEGPLDEILQATGGRQGDRRRHYAG